MNVEENKIEEETTEIIAVQPQQPETFDMNLIATAKTRIKVLAQVKELALKSTNNGDWIDQSGKPYLCGTGCEKVRANFGLSVWDVKLIKHPEIDEGGEYYHYEYSGKVGLSQNEFIEAVGTCSSRDQFFGKQNGEYKPLDLVDITNIKKAAYTNFFVNGVTRFLGLRGLEWGDLSKYGIDRDKVQSVEYRKGSKDTKWTEEQAGKANMIREYIFAECNGDNKAAKAMLEKETSFENDKGETIKGKTNIKYLSGKQIDFLYKKFEKQITAFNNATEG